MEIVRIYCIEDCNGLKYIGSTKRSLKSRLYNHIKEVKYCSSQELDLENCKIYTLEKTDEENRKVREQYWMDNTECVNKCKVIGNKKEREKQYHQENKVKRNQYRRNYHKFIISWGGDSRYNNNLLKIDLDIFI